MKHKQRMYSSKCGNKFTLSWEQVRSKYMAIFFVTFKNKKVGVVARLGVEEAIVDVDL